MYDAAAHPLTVMDDSAMKLVHSLQSDCIPSVADVFMSIKAASDRIARFLMPISQKVMLDTYANPALGEPWPTNWLAAPGLPDPTIGRKRRARRARGKRRQAAAATRLANGTQLKYLGIKQLPVSKIMNAERNLCLYAMPGPVLKRNFAYRIGDLPA